LQAQRHIAGMTKFRSGCQIASSIDLVSYKWTLVILRSMAIGARAIPISRASLRKL
jgi:hypothetical protein